MGLVSGSGSLSVDTDLREKIKNEKRMLNVIELNHMDDLKEFQADWNRLLTVTPGGSFFQSLDWLEVYWRHFSEEQQLRVCVVRDANEVTGIVPLCVRRITTKFGPCSILTFPFDDWGSVYGPVSADPETTLTTVLEYVSQSRRDWDLIDLRCVDRDHFDGGATERAFQTQKMSFESFDWNETMYINLDQTWDEYLTARPRKARQTYLRAERKVAEDGEIEYLRYRPRGEVYGEADPRWDLYEQCLQVAGNSWQAASTDGTTLIHDKVADFFRDSYASAIRAGGMDLNLISLSGKPAAFCYNYYFNGRLDGLKMGFDAQLSRNGLGRLLLGRVIHDSMDRGDLLLDMGCGAQDAKKYWYTSIEKGYRYVHYSTTSPIGHVLKLSHQVAGWFRNRFSSGDESEANAVPQHELQAARH